MLKKCQDHLETVHESYGAHACFAATFGLKMVGAGVAAIIHAFIPALFQSTGSRILFSLHKEITERQAGCAQKKPD